MFDWLFGARAKHPDRAVVVKRGARGRYRYEFVRLARSRHYEDRIVKAERDKAVLLPPPKPDYATVEDALEAATLEADQWVDAKLLPKFLVAEKTKDLIRL